MKTLRYRLMEIAAFLPLCLEAAPAAAQQQLPEQPGPWSPPGVEASFPEAIGPYLRGSIYQYAPEDWSVGYDRIEDGKTVGIVTVYVYFAHDPRGCPAEFSGAKTAIENAHPDAAIVQESRAESPGGGTKNAADHARYRFIADIGRPGTQVHSDAYVYCHPGSRWTIKYRATWPADTDHSADAAMILRGIAWGRDIAR